jgi:hypothetical protein
MSRAFRPHLSGIDLERAQEKFLAALLRSPSLWASAARSNIGRSYFSASLRPVFDVATGSPEKVRDIVVSGNNPLFRRIFGIPVHLHHGVVLALGRQIVESLNGSPPVAHPPGPKARERSASIPEAVGGASVITTSGSAEPPSAMPHAGDEWTRLRDSKEPTSGHVVSETTATLAAGVPEVGGPAVAAERAAEQRKPIDIGRPAVMVFLRDILAKGPLPAKQIERLAVDAGLLPAGVAVGDAKSFRSAKRDLQVRSFQRAGLRSGGWIWELPAPEAG